jgi:hypothetical protein
LKLLMQVFVEGETGADEVGHDGRTLRLQGAAEARGCGWQ